MIPLRDSAEARLWVLHSSALLGAFLLGYLVGPRLAPFLSLLLCRPFVAIAATLLPTSQGRSYRRYLWGGGFFLAALAQFVSPRGTALYLLCMAFVLLLDLTLDSLVVRCCPEEEWVGKAASLGLVRSVGLLLGLVVSDLLWPAPSVCVALVLAGIALLWLVTDDTPRAVLPNETPGVGLVIDAARMWISSSFWRSGLVLVTVAVLAGAAGTTLFPLLVLAPSTISNWLADPWTWAGSGMLWVLLALVLERFSLPSQYLLTLPVATAGVWLASGSDLWSAALKVVLGLAALVAYRATLAAQHGRIDSMLHAAFPLTLWALAQLLGEFVAREWPDRVILLQVFGSIVMIAALWSAYRTWAGAVRIARTTVVTGREAGLGRHGDRTFDFEAAPTVRKKPRSRLLARLWHLIAVRFPVTLTMALLGSFALAGVWHASKQKGTWKAQAENVWMGFQTELFVSRLKVRVEEEMLASNRVPTDWPSFVGSSFQLKGRAMPDRDFWGTPLHFDNLPKGVRITSAGPDRKFATTDDISRVAYMPQGVK